MIRTNNVINAQIKNLGALKSANLDVKPLTVFVGENNTGKTYTAYAFASIFSGFGLENYINAYIKGEAKSSQNIENVYNEFINEGYAQFDIVKFYNEECQDYFTHVADISTKEMPKFLATNNVLFNDLKIKYKFSKSMHNDISKKILSIKLNTKYPSEKSEGLINAKKDEDDPRIFFFSKPDFGNETIKDKLPEDFIKRFIITNIFMTVHRQVFTHTYFLGAERTGLSIFLDKEEIEQEKEFEPPKKQTDSDGLTISVNYPSLDLIGNISTILKRDNHSDRFKYADEHPDVQRIIELSNILESEILGGAVNFSEKEKQKYRQIFFNYGKKEQISIDMSAVSSLIKGLMPLVLYLRFKLLPNDLLIIDEPEMNLHPLAQVKLIELLAMLCNTGVHVLITTHSPYIIDHLTNLIKAGESKNQEAIREKFYLMDSDAFIHKKDVSVYFFNKKKTTNILTKEGLVDWETFSAISEEISNLYFEID